MDNRDTSGLDQFLVDYPTMAIRPSLDVFLSLRGTFKFSAHHSDFGDLTDAFELQIHVPRAFPHELPEVTEIGGRIPKQEQFHLNADGTLCLGSHLRLLIKLKGRPTLTGFADRCLVPYLYAISRKLSHGGNLLFGELDHYGSGMLKDYAQIFGVPTTEQAENVLELLSMKKRVANKRACPCQCKLRLGRCRFNRRLHLFRKVASRGWFKKQLEIARM